NFKQWDNTEIGWIDSNFINCGVIISMYKALGRIIAVGAFLSLHCDQAAWNLAVKKLYVVMFKSLLQFCVCLGGWVSHRWLPFWIVQSKINNPGIVIRFMSLKSPKFDSGSILNMTAAG